MSSSRWVPPPAGNRAELINTASAEVTGSVSPELVQKIPLGRGNVFDLLQLTLGLHHVLVTHVGHKFSVPVAASHQVGSIARGQQGTQTMPYSHRASTTGEFHAGESALTELQRSATSKICLAAQPRRKENRQFRPASVFGQIQPCSQSSQRAYLSAALNSRMASRTAGS